MNRKIALFVSVVFQPLVVPSIVFLLLFYGVPEATSVPKGTKWSLLLLIMLTTLVAPTASIIGMKMNKMIDSLDMATKKERIVPFSIVCLFYLITSAFFYFRLNVDSLMVFSLGVITLCIIILTLITMFWKISAHLTGLSGLLAIIVVLSLKFTTASLLYPLIGTILLCGVVGSARLYLNAHNPTEILGGFLLGFFTCFSFFYYFLMF